MSEGMRPPFCGCRYDEDSPTRVALCLEHARARIAAESKPEPMQLQPRTASLTEQFADVVEQRLALLLDAGKVPFGFSDQLRGLIMYARGDAAELAKAQAELDASETELRIKTASCATACAEVERLRDLTELAWGVIANAGGGNWSRESKDWQIAAAQWRDRYHAPFDTTTTNPGTAAGKGD